MFYVTYFRKRNLTKLITKKKINSTKSISKANKFNIVFRKTALLLIVILTGCHGCSRNDCFDALNCSIGLAVIAMLYDCYTLHWIYIEVILFYSLSFNLALFIAIEFCIQIYKIEKKPKISTKNQMQ